MEAELSNTKNQVKQLQAKLKGVNDKTIDFEGEKQQLLDRIKMLTKTNTKLSKSHKETEAKLSDVQKELQSKWQRLEMFRNYKTSIESKSKALVDKVTSKPFILHF